MSFQLQHGSLARELQKAGLEAAAADRIAKILSNPSQPMRSGPVEVDTTPHGMRNITPDRRKFQLTNLDFRDADPDFRRARVSGSESRPKPMQPSAVQESVSPQQTDKPFGVSAGSFTEARSSADGVAVGLRVSGSGQFLTQDPSSGTLVGKSMRAEADAGENGFLRFFIEEQANEVVLKIQLDRDRLQDILEDILGVTIPGRDDTFPAPNPLTDAIVDVSLTGDGLCFRKVSGATLCIPIVACDPAQQ